MITNFGTNTSLLIAISSLTIFQTKTTSKQNFKEMITFQTKRTQPIVGAKQLSKLLRSQESLLHRINFISKLTLVFENMPYYH